jgi:drug/metabolite transporter (DMT)-like permease
MPDDQQLKRLSNLHMGLGVLMFVSFPLLFALSLAVLPAGEWGAPVWLGGLLLLVLVAVALMASSRALEVRSQRRFSLVCGAVALLLFPIGTVVGVYTLRVLTRPDIVAAYTQGRVYWPH